MKYVFWILALLNIFIPLIYLEYSSRAMLVSFILLILPELKQEKLLIAMWLLYWTIIDVFITPSTMQCIIESCMFSAWLLWVIRSKFINYLPYNKNNLCVAFYRGENHSFKAKLSSLIGLDVTSVGIYDGEIHRYKKGKLITSKAADEYIMYDTGIPVSGEIKDKILNISKAKYRKSWYKSNCVGILTPLMVELHIQPHGYLETIPSIYLRRLLNNGKR